LIYDVCDEYDLLSTIIFDRSLPEFLRRINHTIDAGVDMAKPKFASLSSDMITRGLTSRRVRIIGPDGQFVEAWTPIEADIVVRCCDSCGSPLPA
jgi:hypothetical protein